MTALALSVAVILSAVLTAAAPVTHAGPRHWQHSRRLVQTADTGNTTSDRSSSSTRRDGPPLPGDTFSSMNANRDSSSSSNPSDMDIKHPSDNHTAFGSALRPYEQCGGTGGYCNRTTIGVPCSDHPWHSVTCPEYYNCARSNHTYWSCQPVPPNAVSPRVQPITRRISAPTARPSSERYGPLEGNGTWRATADVNGTKALTPDGEFTAQAVVGDRPQQLTSNESFVRVCGPGDLAVGSQMCIAGSPAASAAQVPGLAIGLHLMLLLITLLLAIGC